MDVRTAGYPFDPSQYRYTGPANGTRRPITHSQYPVTTGTSVVAVVYDGGVMMAADMLGSYGSLARYKDVPRLLAANERVLLGCTGDYADFQFLSDVIEQHRIDEDSMADGISTNAPSMHCWLTRILYNRRSRFDPLWTTFVVAGFGADDQPFLGFVDKLGTAYTAPQIATGLGAAMVTPLLREAMDGRAAPLTQDQARKLLQRAMSICFYRDCRAYPRYQLATVTRDGINIEDGLKVQVDWQLAHFSQSHDA